MEIYNYILKENHRVRPGGNYKKTSITIHSTANISSTAINERKWLDNSSNLASASWHYVVDDKMAIQAIPDNEEAWHCANKTGNCYSISIEICESGDRVKAIENAAALTAQKIKQYNLKISDIKKHFDWSGKICPRILIDKNYIEDDLDWNYFLKRVKYYMEEKKQPQWKIDAEKYLRDNNIISDSHDPEEIIDMGTLGVIIKNVIEKYIQNIKN